ncbi:TPA: TetR family transcriptional regulator [Pseudomonas putida]|nr:TetR family transcriptional regulator [Pseudomonas putida]
MTSKRKPADAREKDLLLALARIQRKRSHTGETKVSIAAVAREAGVSTALIHNHYPKIAEAIRTVQGRDSRSLRDVKHQELIVQRKRNRELREEIKELRSKVASLASINEMLLSENRILKSKQSHPNVFDLVPKS